MKKHLKILPQINDSQFEMKIEVSRINISHFFKEVISRLPTFHDTDRLSFLPKHRSQGPCITQLHEASFTL